MLSSSDSSSSLSLSLKIWTIEMAYAAVASVSETIDIVLKYHKESISPEFEDQMKSVQKHSVVFRSFLEEFRERGNNWDETIREVTDRAEEIIELLLSDLLVLEIVTTTSGGSRSRSRSSLSKCEMIYYSSLGDLERVIEEMESISNRVKGKHVEAAGGADEELMEIICRLGEGSSSREVIAIVGREGMGKAALAKKAFNHPLIVEYFHIRAWSTISYDHTPKRIIVELLRSMKLAESGQSISDPYYEMIDNLCKKLRGRRYLIVLNDIWSIHDWYVLERMFRDDGNGSRIIITTRSSNLCEAVNASYIHHIRLLDEDRAWNLVRENVFGGDPCPSQLESVGKMIAGSCGGHPLCIQVVSRMLAAADHTLAAWEDILQNMNINANEDDDKHYLMNVLALSYTYLPHHLKMCFLYFGCFPKGHDIRVSRLVKLWVAEGFVSEDIGEENVEDLVRRGLVSVTKTKSNGSRIKSVAIHDLMRDVCLRQSGIDNFNIAVHGRYVEPLWCRRVTTSDFDDFPNIIEGAYGSTIRTIILSSDAAGICSLRCSIGNYLRLLRVLDLLCVCNDLADQVFKLFHLRYLAFLCRSKLSTAISNLQNLQTLIIRPINQNDGRMFDNLANRIWMMPQLRHLFVFHLTVPAQMGGVMSSALEDLQTLSRVVNFVCSRDNLKFIPNLKKLDLLYYPKDDVVQEDYELHNLLYLHKLQTLKIEMNGSFVEDYKMRFAFPPSLNKLNLCGLQLPWEDLNKIVASLPNLQVLKLREDSCIGDTWETSGGGFSQLIYLLIQDSSLMSWKTKTSHFPKLKQLVLRHCPRLLEVPDDIGKIQTLELIEVDRKDHSLVFSVNLIQKDRQSSGDDRLHISRVV